MSTHTGIGVSTAKGGGQSWSRYWATLLTTIGYNHPMLPGLTINKVAGKFAITSHDIDDFRASYPTPIVKYLNWSTGLDTNDGDTPATAYKTLAKLNGVTYNRAYIAAGNYASANSTNVFTNTREVFGSGGVATLMRGATGENLTWTDDTGGMFHATTTLVPVSCFDSLQTDSDGRPYLLTKVANSTLVASTANSWYKDAGGGVIYVHLTDDSQPGNNFYFQTTYIVAAAGKQCYAEDIRFIGLSATNATATPTIIALKDCFILGSSGNGFSGIGNVQTWFEDTRCDYSASDGFNYSASGGYNCSTVEVGVITKDNGTTVTGSNNGSSGHDSTYIIRLNSNHQRSEGPCLHEVHSSISLNISCPAGNSIAQTASKKTAYACGGGTVGETCTLYLWDCDALGTDDGTYGADNRTPATAKIYTHNCTIPNLTAGTVLMPF